MDGQKQSPRGVAPSRAALAIGLCGLAIWRDPWMLAGFRMVGSVRQRYLATLWKPVIRRRMPQLELCTLLVTLPSDYRRPSRVSQRC